MKTIKYTAVALALIAAASFTSSAKAATPGDLILGIYDTSGTNPNSYEVDLGSYTSLTAGESFNLGSTISTLFGASSSLEFDIAAAGKSTSGTSGGLAQKQVVLTAQMLPASLPAFGGNTTPTASLSGEYQSFGASTSTVLLTGTSSSSIAFTAESLANTDPGAFKNEIEGNNGDYGFGSSGTPSDILTPYSLTASVPLYSILNSSGQESASQTTKNGTGDSFVFSGTANGEILTFDPVATPEPSAYALGLCAAALFWVLNRRRTVA